MKLNEPIRGGGIRLHSSRQSTQIYILTYFRRKRWNLRSFWLLGISISASALPRCGSVLTEYLLAYVCTFPRGSGFQQIKDEHIKASSTALKAQLKPTPFVTKSKI